MAFSLRAARSVAATSCGSFMLPASGTTRTTAGRFVFWPVAVTSTPWSPYSSLRWRSQSAVTASHQDRVVVGAGRERALEGNGRWKGTGAGWGRALEGNGRWKGTGAGRERALDGDGL